MKKKIIGTILSLMALMAVAAPSHVADADVTYSDQCCDSTNTIRCYMSDGMYPLGAKCYCKGLGTGHICA